jgi:pullulanase
MLGNGRSEVVYQVTRVDVSSVRILPRVSALGVGEVFQLEAQATDRLGSALAGRVVTWLSTDTQVVVVSKDGRIKGTGAGRARVSASIGAGLASIDLTVSPPVVTGVRIEPSALTLRVGETGQVRASVQGSRGTTLPGVAVEWASSDPQIAAVSAEGLVTALRFGTARIAATAGGRRATLGVEVRSSSVTTISAPRVRIGGEKA